MSTIIIETNRLHLRPINHSDAVDIFDYRSLPEVYKYQSWIPTSKADVEEFIEQKVEKVPNIPDTWYQLAIISKEHEQLVGDIGIHFLDSKDQKVEIGYTLSPKFQGKGYATEAVTGAIDYLFKTLRKESIFASVDPHNQRSINLLERIGMRHESHFRDTFRFSNEWPDDLIYAIFAEEWLNKSV